MYLHVHVPVSRLHMSPVEGCMVLATLQKRPLSAGREYDLIILPRSGLPGRSRREAARSIPPRSGQLQRSDKQTTVSYNKQER